MSYVDSGFDNFQTRTLLDLSAPEEDIEEVPFGAAGTFGRAASPDGRLVIDYTDGVITIGDGARTRVKLGVIAEDDGFGIKIIDASGNVIMTTAGQVQTEGIADDAVTGVKIASLSVSKLTAGTFDENMNLGAANIQIDGENKRILINDGTDDRILIGFQSGGF